MTVRLLADENCHPELVEALRGVGWDVRFVLEEASGIDDVAVLAMGLADQRVLLSNDSDFPRLIYSEGHKAIGLIYLRLTLRSPVLAVERVRRALTAPELSPEGHSIVVEDDRFRRRALPLGS